MLVYDRPKVTDYSAVHWEAFLRSSGAERSLEAPSVKPTIVVEEHNHKNGKTHIFLENILLFS